MGVLSSFVLQASPFLCSIFVDCRMTMRMLVNEDRGIPAPQPQPLPTMPRNSRKSRAVRTIFIDDSTDEENSVTTHGVSDTVSAGGRSVTRSRVVHVTPRSPSKSPRTADDDTDADTAGTDVDDETSPFDEGNIYQIQLSDLATVPRKTRRNNYFMTTVSV